MKLRFFLLLFLVGIATARIWEDGDTVIIEADSSRSKRENPLPEEYRTEDEDTISIRSQRCVTPRGKTGQCMTLKECYPILFPIDPSVEMEPGTTLNDPLADQLIASSGFCSGGVYSNDSPSLFAQVVKAEVLVCCVQQSKTPAELPPEPPNITVSDTTTERSGCGQIKVRPEVLPSRIVGGREAARGEFPWIVALMSSGKEFCGGSLIDSQNVVTAAHCVQHMGAADVQKLTIQIGDHDIYSTADGRHQVRTATKILYHRQFSMQHLHHDVALIALSSPVQFTNYIQPVCLNTGSPNYDNAQADVAGWGQLRDGGPQPSKLQTANVRIWTHNDCSQRYGNNAPAGIGKGMVCAGGSGKDSCRGDSGGPLTINSRTRAVLTGVVSWGVGCGTYPGVYTRVDQYLSWISKNRRRSYQE